MQSFPNHNSKSVLLPLVVIVAALYFTREFLIPLALAILFSFLLAPLVQRLDRWGFGRVASVLTSALFAFLVVAGIGYAIGGQLIDLAHELPKYQTNLDAKIKAFKVPQNGAINQIAQTVKKVTADFAKEQADGAPAPAAGDEPAARNAENRAGADSGKLQPATGEVRSPATPVPVSIVSTSTGTIETLKMFVEPVLAPLGTAALVVLLVIFFLLEREDMRDRLIHLIGRSHLQVTTMALDEAAFRVSRYLLAQLAVNVVYGIPIAVGLYFIGVPNAVLWGMLATIFRFVPYIGPWIAASFPILLSIAVLPGWKAPMLIFGLFLTVELLVSNALEPWLYGSSTGMSPIAIIAAAAFWTWLWGGIGLLMAIPLTVCIAVLGKYIPSLTFLDVLLGDKPPIAVEDRLYQRLLATDEDEVTEILEKHVEKHSLADAFEELIVPTLRLAEEDALKGSLNEPDRARLLRDVHDIVSDLDSPRVPSAPPAGATPAEAEPTVLCIPASDLGDEIGCLMLARLLAEVGVSSRVVPSKLLASEMLEAVAQCATRQFCVSVNPPGSTRQAVYVCKRLRDRFPEARILVGMWGEATSEERRLQRIRHARVDVIFTSLKEAAKEIAGTAAATRSAPVAETLPSHPAAVK